MGKALQGLLRPQISSIRRGVVLRMRTGGQTNRRATGGEESLGTSSPAAAGPRQNPAQTRTDSGDSRPRDLLRVKVKQLRGPGGARRRRSSTATAERGALHGGVVLG